MSGIDRVGGGLRPEGPEGPKRPERARTEKTGEFAGQLEPSRRSEGAAPTGEATFPTLRDRILEGVGAELPGRRSSVTSSPTRSSGPSGRTGRRR